MRRSSLSFRGIPIFVVPASDPPFVVAASFGFVVSHRGSDDEALAAVRAHLRRPHVLDRTQRP